MSDAVILWVRRDLRLSDNPVLAAAAASGRPVVPVFILDAETERLGAAAKWRLGLALAAFSAALEGVGSRLILRRGAALAVLQDLQGETGARAVWWGRLYDPDARARDGAVKAALRAQGVEARSFPGFLLHEPWEVQTGEGGFYKVYTPFWKAVAQRVVGPGAAPVAHLPAPGQWPRSEALQDWRLGQDMARGAAVCAPYQAVGEAAARARLDAFMAGPVHGYRVERDFVGVAATSGLSENLTYGEISARTLWHAGWRAMQEGVAGAEHFLREVVWREFAWSLMYHTPHIASRNWRANWEGFGWRGDNADAEAWRRGRTGEPFVDAAMREVYVTGKMHNRARMIVASYLTKHLLTDWRVGQAWFAEVLSDWDPAANAMGWQWVAGCGPDASPYFRVFNPAGQAEKFDASGLYRKRWIAELQRHPGPEALSFFDAVPKSWGLSPAAAYPMPLVDLAEGRARALLAYAQAKDGGAGAETPW